MKILITGSGGQLGNELISILKTGKSEIGEIDKSLLGAEVLAIDVDTLDITKQDETVSFIKENRPDVIINCAAATNVDGCESNSDLAFKVNAEGVKNLAIGAKSVGAKLVQVSTDYVFSGEGDRPYLETDPINPQSVYGRSKAKGEEYATKENDKTFIVRTAWLYGYIGKNFVKTVRRVLREKGGMSVVNDQIGNPTNANDLAHHILKLIPTKEYGIYHCTGEGECSWYDFAAKIAELSGFKGAVKPCTTSWYNTTYNVPTKRPSYSSLENAHLKETVGNEMRNWEEAIEEYIKNVKD
ncbi:MAG: dTDP-4-dehydrorhamnose reductase [Clostridia bacterium]|nr:dTDP-4-dehydrorhamnose reductase [Clostridia bacterium]